MCSKYHFLTFQQIFNPFFFLIIIIRSKIRRSVIRRWLRQIIIRARRIIITIIRGNSLTTPRKDRENQAKPESKKATVKKSETATPKTKKVAKRVDLNIYDSIRYLKIIIINIIILSVIYEKKIILASIKQIQSGHIC